MNKRPALRYYGGKWKLGKWIISHFPGHKIYVEPFGGAASVLLQKERSYAEVYNDLDGEICNVFRVLRDHPEELERVVKLTPFARAEFDKSYTPADCPVEQARRTIFRSFAGFGSTAASCHTTAFRNNLNRSGSTPAHDWKNWSNAISGLAERMQGVVIENRPYEYLLDYFDSNETLFYVDPPYLAETRNSVGYRHDMKHADDHKKLIDLILGLEGMVIVSGYASDLYTEMLVGWETKKKETWGDGACERTEYLWLNPAAARALNIPRQISMFSEVSR